MSNRIRVWQAALQAMQEMNRDAVRQFDDPLLKRIAELAGIPEIEDQSTSLRVVNMIQSQPGPFVFSVEKGRYDNGSEVVERRVKVFKPVNLS